METNIFNESFGAVPVGFIPSNSTLTQYAVLTADPCAAAALAVVSLKQS